MLYIKIVRDLRSRECQKSCSGGPKSADCLDECCSVPFGDRQHFRVPDAAPAPLPVFAC